MKIKSQDVLTRIQDKFKKGKFVLGNDCSIGRYTTKRGDIKSVPYDERTPELCAGMMSYCRCKLSDVPLSSRTRGFYIEAFTDKEVFNYIKNNIDDFDRQFFKDLIVSNSYATHFEDNCFAVMPLEYIDEEMCSIAILKTQDWSATDWFYTVYRRKPEALTADLWKRGARLYSRMSGDRNEFLEITPDKFKDEEYYKEMCSCNYNAGMALSDNKGRIMNSIPKEFVTKELLVNLFMENHENVIRFSEEALEMTFDLELEGSPMKMWQIAVLKNGHLIGDIELNEERINFFLKYFDKDSNEYRWGFKDKYKRYLKKQQNPEELNKIASRERENLLTTGESVIFNALLYHIDGEDPTKAVEDEIRKSRQEVDTSLIPIYYRNSVPSEFCKQYDNEEYLELMYKELGIEIVEQYDSLLFKVILPEGWEIVRKNYWNDIQDENGHVVIKYLYDSKFYDRDAYVSEIYVSEEKMTEIKERVLKR